MRRDEVPSLSGHILPASATMVGVCMTVISIVKITPQLDASLIDEALALDSVLFLASAILSFVSMRSAERGTRLERWAETMFLVALGFVAIVAVILAFEFG